MIKIRGKYGTATVYADEIRDSARDQIQNLMDDSYTKGSLVRIMPDVHAGADNVIGLTMTIGDKISPYLIGSDIGCGVMLHEIETDEPIDLQVLDDIIRTHIPHGPNIRDDESINEVVNAWAIPETTNSMRLKGLEKKALQGIGTLGGGNHFIELYYMGRNRYGLAIHTGSRSVGGAVFKHYRAKTIDNERLEYRTLKNKTVWAYKRDGREKELQAELNRISKLYNASRNKGRNIRYLEGQDKDDYLHDMRYAQYYAFMNRMTIAILIINALGSEGYGVKRLGYDDKPHNYVDLDRGILRKGSQSAEEGETVLIPINMRDGMLIGRAIGNRNWNYSAPHGAGRVLSRTEAKDSLSIVKFREDMKDVFSTVVGRHTLDEAPAAYKTLEEISTNSRGTVEIMSTLRPIYNFKGGYETGARTNVKTED